MVLVRVQVGVQKNRNDRLVDVCQHHPLFNKSDQLGRLSDILQMQVTDKVSVRSPKLLRVGSIPTVCAEDGEHSKGQIPLGYPLPVSPEEYPSVV